MTRRTSTPAAVKWIAGALALAAGAYAGYVGITWLRFRHHELSSADDADSFLDQFMPVYDIVERLHIDIAAPADVTFAAARETDFQESSAARAIFKAREKILGSEPDSTTRPRGLLALTKSIGWGVLAEIPGQREIVDARVLDFLGNVPRRVPDRVVA